MKTVFKRFKYIFLLALMSFTALTSLLSQPNSKVYAAIAPDATTVTGSFESLSLTDQAKVWSTYSALKAKECNFKANMSDADIKAGKWLVGDTAKVGLHVDGGDGKLGCDNENNWFSNLLDLAGFANDYLQPANAVFTVRNGVYNPKPDNTSRATLLNLIANKIFQGNIPGVAPNQAMYQIMYANFVAEKGCGGAVLAPNVNNQPKNSVSINVYDAASNTVKLVPYGYSADKTDAPVVGFGVNDGGDAKLQCQTIADRLKNAKYADATKAFVAANPNTAGGGSSNNDAGDPNLECDVSFNPLTWVLCPIVKGMTAFIEQLDNGITSLLKVDQAKIFETTASGNTTSGDHYYSAWKTFRGFALAILIIAALTMVIAQGLGFEILDAYTIKKIFPRLALAIIGIALSWELMKFFVVFTNDLGEGIRQIIYTPFTTSGMDTSLELGGGAKLILNIVGGGAILALGIVGLLSFAATAALAIGIAFLVLIVRQLVIIVLVLFAPIAIACSILPNTQSVYKLWYESFTKALLMFPIIVAFLAVGRIFAVTSVGNNVGNATAISQLIGYAAYIMPYFLIPLTFRFAGGLMRTLGGSFNDRSRGGFDRLRKYRNGKTAENMSKIKSGTRYRPTNALARGFNTATGSTSLALSEAGVNPFQMRSRYNSAKTEHTLAEMDEVRKSSAFIAGSQDDRVLRAAQYGKGIEGIRRHLSTQEGVTDAAQLDSLTGTALRMQSSGPREAVDAAIAMQRFATGTGYNKKDKNGNEYFDYDDAFGSIRDASGGNQALAGTLLGQAKGVASGAGQLAFGGASYGALSKGLGDKFRYNSLAEGRASEIALDAYDGTDAMTAARARGPHLQAMAAAATDRINNLTNNTAADAKAGELGQRAAQLENWSQTTGMYGAPNRQTIVNNQVAQADAALGPFRPREPQSSSEKPSLISVPAGWTPGKPIPTSSPTQPTGPQPSPADAMQYARNRGARPNPTDPRTRDQMQPPEPK